MQSLGIGPAGAPILHSQQGESPHWTIMRNPWVKKNPFMSAWLSAANSAVGTARGRATNEARRQAGVVRADATRQVIGLWLGPMKKVLSRKTRR